MKIAVTGGTGFIGHHLVRQLSDAGHQVVVIARGVNARYPSVEGLPQVSVIYADLLDKEALLKAFQGCQAIAHCAGMSQESPDNSFEKVHIDGTKVMVEAAKQAKVGKVVVVSYLLARPGISSRYHTTKYEGEEIVRNSGINFVILKPGMIFGKNGHMLERPMNILKKMPLFAGVGLKEKTVRLMDVEEVATVVRAAVLENRLDGKTCAIVGPEEMPFTEAVRRMARVMGKPVFIVPMPVFFHRLLALVSALMPKPLISASQVEMLAEGASHPLPGNFELPDDLKPKIALTEEVIRQSL